MSNWEQQLEDAFRGDYPFASVLGFFNGQFKPYWDEYTVVFREWVTDTLLSDYLFVIVGTVLVAVNFVYVFLKTNGLNQIAVFATVLRSLFTDFDLLFGITFHSLLNFIIGITRTESNNEDQGFFHDWEVLLNSVQ